MRLECKCGAKKRMSSNTKCLACGCVMYTAWPAAHRPRGDRPTRDRVMSQRYTEGETRLIESVAGGDPGGFIRDAAIDRARLFAEQGAGGGA